MLSGDSPESLLMDMPLPYDPPRLRHVDDPEGFRYHWRQLHYVFDLPNPSLFPALPAPLAEEDSSLVERFIRTTHDLAKDPPRVSREEIAALLAGSPDRYRLIIGVAVSAGLRQAEVLGLRWSEIDFKTGVLRVRHQLTRGDRSTPPRAARLKTKAGIRDVILLADPATLLPTHLRATEKEHGLPRPDDFVFTTSTGGPMNYRNVSTRGLDKAAEAASLNPTGVAKLTFHDLRHTYCSHLAQSGLDPVGVQRQMGHARPSITMDLYVHEFETARRREQVTDRLTAALGGLIESDKF